MAQKNNVTKLDESAKVVNEVITSMRFLGYQDNRKRDNETGEVTKRYNIFVLNYASINADRGFFLSPEVVNKWVKDKAAADLEPVLEHAKLLQEVWVKAVITQMGERSFTRITEFLTEEQVKVLKQMGLLQSKGELSEPAEILPENSEDEEADPF